MIEIFRNILLYRRKQESYRYPANDENNYKPKKLSTTKVGLNYRINAGFQHLENYRGL